MDTLRELSSQHPHVIEETWLCAGAVYARHGPEQAKGGWLLEPPQASNRSDPAQALEAQRPRLVARTAAPEWLAKLLPFNAEC